MWRVPRRWSREPVVRPLTAAARRGRQAQWSWEGRVRQRARDGTWRPIVPTIMPTTKAAVCQRSKILADDTAAFIGPIGSFAVPETPVLSRAHLADTSISPRYFFA